MPLVIFPQKAPEEEGRAKRMPIVLEMGKSATQVQHQDVTRIVVIEIAPACALFLMGTIAAVLQACNACRDFVVPMLKEIVAHRNAADVIVLAYAWLIEEIGTT